MKRNNIDLIVDKLLKDSKNLTPEMVKAYGSVIEALVPDKRVEIVPNNIKQEESPNSEELTEDVPQDLSDIRGIEVEGIKGSRRRIKIIPPQKV